MFYKGTYKQCEEYNQYVAQQLGLYGTTINWDEIVECEGYWAILKNDTYPSSTLEEISMSQLQRVYR